MSFFLYLNSRDYNHPQPNYDLYFPINSTSLQNIARFQITLQSIEFPNAVYPINEFNNVVSWYEGVTLITAVLTSGNYTGSTLGTHLASVMNAASANTYTVTYNTDQKTYTISTSTNFYMNNASLSVWRLLGLHENTVGATSQVSKYPIIISGTNYVDIVTSFNTNSISSTTTASILCRVPINVQFSEIVYYEPANANTISVELPALRELFFRLYDDHGNYYKLPTNNDISICLKITPL